jgi:hypothetical protein
VDRILRQQKAERHGHESGKDMPGNVTLISRPPSVVARAPTPPAPRHSQLESPAPDTNQPTPSTNSFRDMIRQKIGSSRQPAHPPPQVPTTPRPTAQRPVNPSSGVTPLSNIGKNKPLILLRL